MDAEARALPAGVPHAVIEVGRGLRADALHSLGCAPPSGVAGVEALLDELTLPLRLEPDWPGPARPQRVGAGWVQADLTDDDRDTFDRLRGLHPRAQAEELSLLAQEWRLPVVPYRELPPVPRSAPAEQVRTEPTGPDPADLRVLDLTSLWAGPFATAMLAERGAAVTKIDPDCRPDGFRERPHLHRRLNQAKEILDLDLRRPSDRDRFERLVATADLLVTSFSRRVLPNLGYGPDVLRRLNPTLTTVAIVGFEACTPEADWLAYGSGIHAICGLGLDRDTGVARATPVAYPDPLTGYLAVSASMRTVGSGAHTEVPLVHAGRLVARQETVDRAVSGASTR